ncbi:MAG: hypothetical protein HC799_10685 [Limnothrix sp. RL_2_0]|nr:hypothetical protein [Limnothrix sp. RL_2_0]
MTTEREFEEWAEKIRRVRGQAPAPTRRRKKYPLWVPVVLFLTGLAIAVTIANQTQQQPEPPSRPLQEFLQN